MYQDGRVAPLFHYTSSVDHGQVALRSDKSSAPFGLGTPGPLALATEGQVGSSPIPPGQTYAGTLDGTTITLAGCGAVLYWAQLASRQRATAELHLP